MARRNARKRGPVKSASDVAPPAGGAPEAPLTPALAVGVLGLRRLQRRRGSGSGTDWLKALLVGAKRVWRASETRGGSSVVGRPCGVPSEPVVGRLRPIG